MINRFFICLLIFVLWAPLSANAENLLENWRQQVTDTRKLADNDPVQAKQQAKQLQQSIPANADATDRIRVLNLLTRTEVYLAQTEPAAEHARQALALAKQRGDKIGQVEAQLNIYINAVNQAKLDESIAAVTDSVELLQGQDRPDLLAEAMMRLSMAYLRMNFPEEAVTLALQNVEIANQNDDPLALTYAYFGLAITYQQNSRYQEAHDFYQKMYAFAVKAHTAVWEGHAIIGIAATLHSLDNKDPEIQERLLQEAIAIFQQPNFPFSRANALYTYAEYLIAQHRNDEATTIYNEIVAITKQYHSQLGLWFTLQARAKNFQLLGRDQDAHTDIEQAYQIANDIGYANYISQSAQSMAEISVAKGDYAQAYNYLEQSQKTAEQFRSERASNRITILTERYKEESKQRQIDKLNLQAERQATKLKQTKLQQQFLWTILIISLLLPIGATWFLLKLRRSNQKLTLLNEVIQHAQNKLQATLNAIPDLLFVLDKDGVFDEFHSSVHDLVLIPPEEFIGKTLREVLPPEMAEISMSALHEANVHGLSTGKQIELPLTDGNHWFELSIARMPLMSDDKHHFVVLSRDISERKKMEQALTTSEQQFRALVENSPDGIVRYDRQGKRTYFNPVMVQIFGSVDTAKNVLGKTLDEWSLPSFNDQDYKERLFQVIKTGVEARLLMYIKTAINTEHYSDIRFVPEFDINGQVTSVLAVGRDITLLKEAERAIAEANNQLRELAVRRDEMLEEERKRIARDMHDELGQYLTTLRMSISVLRMQYGSRDKKMEEQLLAMMALLDTTLQVVRQIASQLRPAQLQMGIIAALEWLVEDFEKSSNIICQLDSECDDLQMTENQAIALFRIVQESLTNIVRYAQASQVNISLQLQEKKYHLQIKDNGIGFNLHDVQKNSFGLLGIRERAINLGGQANIISFPGKGTTIEAFFPAKKTKG